MMSGGSQYRARSLPARAARSNTMSNAKQMNPNSSGRSVQTNRDSAIAGSAASTAPSGRAGRSRSAA